MQITYEKFDDYYIFSHQPEMRVYLGDASPEDYIWDEEQQAKRSVSSWYKEVHTGKEITWDDIRDYEYDGSKPGNGCVWYGSPAHDFDKRENYTFEGGHSHDFVRRLHLSQWGNLSTGKGCKYLYKDKAMERLAHAYFFNQSLEQYDAQQEEFRKEREKQKRESPALYNLMMVSGETYYVDDNDQRITVDEHCARMKAELGEDCFEIADAKIREEHPEAYKAAQEFVKRREAMVGMTREQSLEYLATLKAE